MKKPYLVNLFFLVIMTIIFDTTAFAKEINSKKELTELFSTTPKPKEDRPNMHPYRNDGGFLFSSSEILSNRDTVQTDGSNIYYIVDNILYLVDAKDTSKIIKKLDFTVDNFSRPTIYLDKQSNTLILMGDPSPKVNRASIIEHARNTFVKIIVFDLNLNELRSFSITGFLANITANQDSIYLISQNYLKYYDGKENLPICYDSITKRYTEIGFDKFYYYDSKEVSTVLLNITSINIKDLSKPVSTTTYLGDFNGSYFNKNTLYLTSLTELKQFEVQDDNINLITTKSFKDTGLYNYDLNQHNGYFRLIKEDYLYIYDKDFNLVSKTKIISSPNSPFNLLYGVKFMGDNIFIQNSHTLCIVDAKDPTKPTIKANIEIPNAYAVYYEPYDENHVLAMIINAEKNVGLKYVLYDISNPKNPKEKFSKVLGDVGSYPEFMYSEGSFLLNKDINILATSVILTKKPYSDDGKFIGTAIYSLDLKNGFTEKALLPDKSSKIINLNDKLYILCDNQIKTYNVK